MSLRITKASRVRGEVEQHADGYGARLAKLIPAEALGLYGAGQAIVPLDRVDGRIVLAIASLVLTELLRYQATKDDVGRPQWKAIGVAVVSFILWLLALRRPVGIVDFGANTFYVTIAALTWGVFVPHLYKGSTVATPLQTPPMGDR
jgi:hypothetical protein